MKGFIYKITNSVNGKSYIGKTYFTVDRRISEHFSDRNRFSSRPLYRALNKYGINNFIIDTLGIFEEGELENKEIYFISKFDTYNNGYNATLGGDGRRYVGISDIEIIKKYKELKTVKLVSEEIGCCKDTISSVLKNNNIDKHFNKREIFCNELNRNFLSIRECAIYLQDMFKGIEMESIERSIYRVLSGKRKGYRGLTFK